MQLHAFPHDERLPAAAPTETSMRAMETGLALVAIVVALLLNVWR